MEGEFKIDVTKVEMFHGYDWKKFYDLCDHDCSHSSTSVIAWGPDIAHYELLECTLCTCRTWRDGREILERKANPESAKFFLKNREWKKVRFRRKRSIKPKET